MPDFTIHGYTDAACCVCCTVGCAIAVAVVSSGKNGMGFVSMSDECAESVC